MYDKIKTETRDAFLRLYPHGTLEDLTAAIIRHIALNPDVFFRGGTEIYKALIIADEINLELSEIALEEMRRDIMKSDAIIKIISRSPGEPFRSNTVVNSIPSYNEFVGGTCEVIEKRGYLVVFDMQGQYHGRKPNAVIDGTKIYGDMFIARTTKFGDFGDIPLSEPSVVDEVRGLFAEVY